MKRQVPARGAHPHVRLVWCAGQTVPAASAPFADDSDSLPVHGTLALRPAPQSGPNLLLIGLEGDEPQLGRYLPGRRTRSDLSEVTASRLRKLMPDAVALPLMGLHFDATEALRRLSRQGFAGPVLVLCPPLPEPRIVEQELSEAGGEIPVSLLFAA